MERHQAEMQHSSNYCGCRQCPTSSACSRPFGLMMAQMMGLKSKLWPPSSCRIAEKVKDTQLDLNFRPMTSYWVLLLFSCSDVSNSLQPHELQHARLPYPHYLPEFAHTYVHWVGDAIQPSHPLLSPSPPAFSLSQHQCLFQWVDFSPQVTQVLELQHQSFQWILRVDFLYDWLAWSPCCPRDSQESSPQHHNSKASILCCSAFLMVQLSHPDMTTRETIALTRRTFVGKVMSLLFNMLSRFAIAFLPKRKHLLISRLQLLFTVIWGPKKIQSVTVSTFSPSICHEMVGPDATILVFWMLSFKPAFSPFSFTLIKRLFSSYSLSAIRVVSSAYLRLLIFLPTTMILACESQAFHMMYSAY